MGDDREVLREVWQGRIPTAFTLTSEDVMSISPQTFYLMLPRLSYFALATDKVKKYFSKFVNQDLVNEEIWFDFEDTPLKPHLPIGVLYDQLRVEGTRSTGPPWNLTVHFSNFPDKDLLKFDSRESIESQFMSCVKEADQFKHGGRVMSTMQKKDHNQLWQGLVNDKFDQLWAVNRRLMEISPLHLARASTPNVSDTSSSSTSAKSDTEPAETGTGSAGTSSAGTGTSSTGTEFKVFKHIPIRMYQSDRLLSLRLVKPTKTCDNGSERWTTLADLLKEYFNSDNKNSSNQNSKNYENQIVTQGIQPDLETPLQWLAEHLSYPDNFLHNC